MSDSNTPPAGGENLELAPPEETPAARSASLSVSDVSFKEGAADRAVLRGQEAQVAKPQSRPGTTWAEFWSELRQMPGFRHLVHAAIFLVAMLRALVGLFGKTARMAEHGIDRGAAATTEVVETRLARFRRVLSGQARVYRLRESVKDTSPDPDGKPRRAHGLFYEEPQVLWHADAELLLAANLRIPGVVVDRFGEAHLMRSGERLLPRLKMRLQPRKGDAFRFTDSFGNRLTLPAEGLLILLAPHLPRQVGRTSLSELVLSATGNASELAGRRQGELPTLTRRWFGRLRVEWRGSELAVKARLRETSQGNLVWLADELGNRLVLGELCARYLLSFHKRGARVNLAQLVADAAIRSGNATVVKIIEAERSIKRQLE